jgi:hypothetical protein
MADNYASRQASRDSQYSKDYAAWVATLGPDELKEMKRMGLDVPMLAKHGNGAPERDIAESSIASYTPDIPAQADRSDLRHLADDESATVMALATRILRHFVADVMKDANARLTIECLSVALGLNAYDGESMSHIAGRHSITRAAVSKRCVDMTKKLSIPPSRAMRSEKARRIYSQSQIKKSQTHDATIRYT